MAFDYAGAKAAGYSDEEIKAYLERPKEDMGTFLKSTAEATGIPKYLKTLSAAGLGLAAGVGNITGQKWALPLAEKAMKLREETGTTGSVQQGIIPTLKTLGNVGEATTRTVGTVYGLATNPLSVAKTAAVQAPISGTISKLAGGTFSEGAGAGVGSAGYTSALANILAKTKAAKITKETLSPLKKGQAPSLTRGLASQTTEAGKTSPMKFSKPLYWSDYADEIGKLTPEEQVKAIPKYLNELSTQTGMDVKELKSIGFDRIKDVLPDLQFKGGNTTSILEGLGMRREAAQAAYNKKTAVEKVIKMLSGIEKPNVIANARNRAFNSQVQQVVGIKNWDKIVSLYKSPIGTTARNAALYKILGPFFSKSGGD